MHDIELDCCIEGYVARVMLYSLGMAIALYSLCHSCLKRVFSAEVIFGSAVELYHFKFSLFYIEGCVLIG